MNGFMMLLNLISVVGTGTQNKPYIEKRFEVTSYCSCRICCGKYASIPLSKRRISDGTKFASVKNSYFVAGPPQMPFGTVLSIPGYAKGRKVVCKDRGGNIKGNRLDLYMPTHKEARQWGRKWVMVKIYKKINRHKMEKVGNEWER